jgi:endonuclease YncB( thermonuclease family)
LWLLPTPAPFAPLVAKVERVSDGDTVTVVTPEGTRLRIRLLGFDGPDIAHGTIPHLHCSE